MDIKGCLQANRKVAVMMNVHAGLAAKGAIPNVSVCLSVIGSAALNFNVGFLLTVIWYVDSFQ